MEGREEYPRRESASSTSPSLLDEIHAQIIEVDPALPPIPKKRSKSPTYLAPALAAAAATAAATDDDDENLESLSREIVDEMEEDNAASGTRMLCRSRHSAGVNFRNLDTLRPRNRVVLGRPKLPAIFNQLSLGEVTQIPTCNVHQFIIHFMSHDVMSHDS